MSEIKESAKIQKLADKRKSDAIIKIMTKSSDPNVTTCCLEALATINDEAACNTIAHCLEDSDATIKLAACKAALVINTAYMMTHVRHVLSKETNEEVKTQIQELINASR